MTTTPATANTRSRRACADSHLPEMFSEKRHGAPSVPSADAQAMLESLLPDLRAAASYRCRESNGELEADDVLQTMVVALLEKGFSQRYGAGYYLKLATWRARDYCELARIYRKHVATMPLVVDQGGEAFDLAEFMPTLDASPEERVIAAERMSDLQVRLTPEQSKIVALLMDGYAKSEIAERLGVSRARVSQHLAGLRAALAGF